VVGYEGDGWDDRRVAEVSQSCGRLLAVCRFLATYFARTFKAADCYCLRTSYDVPVPNENPVAHESKVIVFSNDESYLVMGKILGKPGLMSTSNWSCKCPFRPSPATRIGIPVHPSSNFSNTQGR